jgi:hypothetical protein
MKATSSTCDTQYIGAEQGRSDTGPLQIRGGQCAGPSFTRRNTRAAWFPLSGSGRLKPLHKARGPRRNGVALFLLPFFNAARLTPLA